MAMFPARASETTLSRQSRFVINIHGNRYWEISACKYIVNFFLHVEAFIWGSPLAFTPLGCGSGKKGYNLLISLLRRFLS